ERCSPYYIFGERCSPYYIFGERCSPYYIFGERCSPYYTRLLRFRRRERAPEKEDEDRTVLFLEDAHVDSAVIQHHVRVAKTAALRTAECAARIRGAVGWGRPHAIELPGVVSHKRHDVRVAEPGTAGQHFDRVAAGQR